MSLHWGASIKGHIDTLTAFVPIATAPVTLGIEISANDLLTYISIAAAFFSLLWNAGRVVGWIVNWFEKASEDDDAA